MKLILGLLMMLSWLQLSYAQDTDIPEYGDLIFLLDSSNNMGEKTFNQLKSFLSRTIGNMEIGVNQYRIGLVQYSDDINVAFSLSTYKAKNPMLNYIKNKFSFQGGLLRTGNALTKIHEIFDRDKNGRDISKYPRVLVVITSGSSSDDVNPSAVALKQDGIRIIAAGVKDASSDDLAAMATSPEFSLKIDNLRDLNSFSKDMMTTIQKVIRKRDVGFDQGNVITTIQTPLITTTTDVPKITDNATAVCDKALATDVVFMVDVSQQSPRDSKDLNNFLKNVVSGLEVSNYCVHVGIVVFNSVAKKIASLDVGINQSHVEHLLEGIEISKEKISNIGAAINFTRLEVFGDTEASRKKEGILQIAILVTHRSSGDNVSEAAYLLRQENVKVFTVGIAQSNETQMTQIASHPTDRYHIRVKTFSELSKQADILLKKITNAADRVTFAAPEITDLIRKGCLNTELADIHFLIDGSGSIYPEDFIAMKTFLVDLVEMYDIGPEKVRVGAVQYAQDSRLEFSINKEYSKTNLKLALQNIRQIGGGTNTGSAINFTHKLIMDPQHARAEKVPVYLIVLTDGESQDSVKEAAQILRRDKVSVYAIGVKEANQTQLEEIAGDPKQVHYVYNFDGLKDIKNVIAQQICSDKVCEMVAADVMFLVDSSGSIGAANFAKMKTFMKNLVNRTEVVEDKVQFGIVQFSGDVKEELKLNKNGTKEIIWNAVDNMIHMDQNTKTGKALTLIADYFTEGKGARPKVKKVLILITDGAADDVVKTPAESLRNSGIVIISVGIFNANKSQLLEISGSEDRVHYLENFDILEKIEDDLITEICTNKDECRIQVADIVFVIDSSTSIGNKYSIIQDFVISVVSKSDVGPQSVQFGALKYSDNPETLFYLNQYQNKQSIIKAIQDDQLLGGNTYTSEALKFSSNFFKQTHGSRHRSGVPQILIVITDGESHDHMNLNETSRGLEDAGITILAVGIDQAKMDELRTMAGTKGKWFFVEKFEGLSDIVKDISDAACNRTACSAEDTDLAFLIDGSTSISYTDFTEMKNFMISIVDDFDVRPGKVHVGIAQFSHKYQSEFKFATYTDKATLIDNIRNITQIFGDTLIGKALTTAGSTLLSPSAKSRIKEGIHQMLVVITDGDSQDEVAQPAQALRSKGIDIYAVGVGRVSDSQLVQIAGSPSSKFSVADFTKLKTIKDRLVREACTPQTASNCSVDVVVAFDISTYPNGAKLFHGQRHLENHLAGILNTMTKNVRSASCNPGVKPQISIAFHMPNAKTKPSALFQIYSPDIARNLKTMEVTGPFYLNSSQLDSMWSLFQNRQTVKGKMLVLFTDGLDEDVEDLEDTVEALRKKGLSALVTVTLEGAKNYDEIQYIEFGRGFEYDYQMHVGMPDIGIKLSKQMSHVAEKICCCVFCKCFGERGNPGSYGKPGQKGWPGRKGSPGHEGEQGEEGARGLPGPKGEIGDKGCAGLRGYKGHRGLPGDMNEAGEPGLDGIPGEQGDSGNPGSKGEWGERGEAGSPGIRGPPGDTGSKGFRGDTGEPGFPSNIPGAKGSKGDPGTEGEPGVPGTPGGPGTRGKGNLPGRRGADGPLGNKGTTGAPGFRGDQGVKGPQGDVGKIGSKGEKGSKGSNGLPGAFGVQGSIGGPAKPGPTGKKGEPGDPGENGEPGPRGQRGLDGEDGKSGYGANGIKGKKGERGFPGNSGIKGEQGDPGVVGERGARGGPGRSITPDRGQPGDPGQPGPPGHRGRKGKKGHTEQNACDLINMIRDTCPCCKGKPTCPAYPTELVFALDAASGMTQAIYTRMIEMVTYMLSRITIRESNCPVGARVAVVAYDTYTNYLIRFYDFHSQEKLLTAVKNIPLKMSSRSRNIGNSMRFVARNIFKRSLQSSTARKIAVFFSNGPSKDVDAINTAVMEYKALGIIPAVITFNPVPAITQAFSMDDTGTFLTMNIPRSGDYKPSIDTLQACTVCLDTCKPDPQCLTNTLTLERKPMDIAFLLDSSYSMKQDDFEAAKGFISTMIDQLDVSSKGDRVAVVSNTPFGFRPNSEEKPHLEFDLTTYDDSLLMKKHLQENTGHLRGPLALGFTLQWTVENVLSTAPDLRKHKAIILIVSGETSSWDKETLSEASLSAKCKGYPLFVIFTGKTYNDTELIDLPSIPIDQHLLQLGRIHKPDFGYAVGFMKCFINSIRRSINKYPSPQLKCSASGSLRGKRLTLHEGDLRSDLLHHSSLNWMSTDDSGDNKMEAVTSTQHTYVTSLSPHNEQGSSNFSGKPEER